jgi:hypothetical protein
MIYRVEYRSMTANYGPNYVEAKNELEAKIKWSQSAFRGSELGLISATPLSDKEIIRLILNGAGWQA